MDVSVVIATKDRPERLKKCLSCLSNQTKKPDEIIIVDGSAVCFGFRPAGLHINYISKKSSMVEARNIGVKESKGDVVVFLDDDAFVENGYVENLMKFYESHPEAGGAEGLVANENNRRLIERLLNFPSFPGRNDIMKMQRLHGCNMSFRRQVFSDFMFDENLSGYYNDDDEFCGRVAKKYRMFFVPAARLVHEQTQYGGARIDHYRNYNTLAFNQFYSLWNLPGKNIFDVLGYLFAQALMIARAFIFIRNGKHLAIKGIMRGYARALLAALKGNVRGEARNL